MSDAELVESLYDEAARTVFLKPISGVSADLFIVERDPTRFLLADTESFGIVPKTYADLTLALARISRDAFAPTHVRVESQDWEKRYSAEGASVQLRFEFAGKSRFFVLPVHGEYFSPRIVDHFNSLLDEEGSPVRFCKVHELGQDMGVMTLSREERKKLETDRGWTFCSVGEDAWQ